MLLSLGHGEINVNGGSALHCGCGGSGGRIGVHARHRIDYGGTFKSSGGKSNACSGGPGTVYTYQSRRGPQYREIKYNVHLNMTEYEPEHSAFSIDNEALVSTLDFTKCFHLPSTKRNFICLDCVGII